MIARIRFWLVKVSDCFKGFPKINSKMIGRKLDDNIDMIVPSKKSCMEEVKEENKDESIIKTKFKNHQVAVLLGYSGIKYFGMQLNHDFKTIERDLINALCEANYIPKKAIEELHVIKFQRAARTDKGVSAARQVVSLKMAQNYSVEKINSYLPEDIRVFFIYRVTKNFNSKNKCEARTYSYTLPTFALAPELFNEYPKDFRITNDMLEKAKAVFSSFVGTHNFHNFTSKKDFLDPSAKRYIMNFNVGKPFIIDEEFITVTVKGQSFMLHQIRKMIGYAIAILKGMNSSLETNAWKEEKYSIPKAPGLGLVLENLHYDGYNRKFGNDGIHTALTWREVADEVENFKKTYILTHIIKKEIEEKSMFNWLQDLAFHKYNYSEDKNMMEEEKKLKNQLP